MLTPLRSVRDWWRTRNCDHPEDRIRSQLIDTGMRKMWWCLTCERTWFS